MEYESLNPFLSVVKINKGSPIQALSPLLPNDTSNFGAFKPKTEISREVCLHPLVLVATAKNLPAVSVFNVVPVVPLFHT